MMSAALEIKSLRGGYMPELDILNGIDLTVRQGESVGIIGLNGSGKSTLGKAVMNMLPYRSGAILLDGEDICPYSTDELARLDMAIMLQGGQVFRNLSAWENLQLAIGNTPDKDYLASLTTLIPILTLGEKKLRSLRADKLSGGQRHQLALAMTLARKPRLIILDEPSAGLSPKAVDEMYSILESVQKALGLTIILIEQNINKAIEFCNRCCLLEQGRIAHVVENMDMNQIELLMFKR